MRTPSRAGLVYSALVLLGVAMLLPIAVLSFYNHPWNDDFCFTWWVDNYGFLGAQLHYYLEWSGRYFSTLMMVSSPVTLRWLPGYQFLGLAIAGLLTCSGAYWIRSLLHTGALATAGLTATWISIVLLGMPSMGETVFWFPSAATYTGGVILAYFIVGRLLRQSEQSFPPSARTAATTVLLILAMLGTTETILLVWCAGAFSWAGAHWWRHRKLDRCWKIYLALTVAAALVMVLAPGNQLRLQRINQLQVYGAEQAIAGDLPAVLMATVSRAFQDLLRWFSASPLWALSFLAVPFTLHHPLPERLRSRFAVPPLKAGILGVGFLMAGYFPSFWATGHVEGRTESLLFLLFLMGWFYFLLLCCYRFRHRLPSGRLGASLCILIAVAGLGLQGFRNTPVQAAYQDWLSGLAARYDQEIRTLYSRLEECDTPVCVVPPTHYRPRSFAVGGVARDPDDWRNLCLASTFFRLERKIQAAPE